VELRHLPLLSVRIIMMPAEQVRRIWPKAYLLKCLEEAFSKVHTLHSPGPISMNVADSGFLLSNMLLVC
jgi:hypothetical protein